MFDKFFHDFYFGIVEKEGYKLILEGLGNTLFISLCALIIGAVLGTVVAIVKISKSKNVFMVLLKLLCSLYTTIIRGTPILVQLLLAHFAIFPAIYKNAPIVLTAIIVFGINSGAYVSEVIRSGILAVDKGQTEAGRTLGLSSFKTMRLIVLPQAIKNILPALGNEFIALIKETSIVAYIGIRDLTRAAQQITGKTYEFFAPYITVSIVYLMIVIGLTQLLGLFERRLRKSDNR
ncbi:MAG TPA: amino acid ABC transporter permease [Clostridiales bacterium]|nr:amino acid ABC transporter permease [Clostridiales bacterium]